MINLSSIEIAYTLTIHKQILMTYYLVDISLRTRWNFVPEIANLLRATRIFLVASSPQHSGRLFPTNKILDDFIRIIGINRRSKYGWLGVTNK